MKIIPVLAEKQFLNKLPFQLHHFHIQKVAVRIQSQFKFPENNRFVQLKPAH
jgi:hypothetical protein